MSLYFYFSHSNLFLSQLSISSRCILFENWGIQLFCRISRANVVFGIAEIKSLQGVFTSTFLGKNPLTRQTRRTFTRSRANLNGKVRNTFIVFFCWNQSEGDNLTCSRVPQSSSSLVVMRRRALGSRINGPEPKTFNKISHKKHMTRGRDKRLTWP